MTKPIIALMYDFDKTLCTKDMQEYTFIPNLGISSSEFWGEADELAKREQMDSILAYMRVMIRQSQINSKAVHRSSFVKMGENLEFFPGVEDWFSRVNKIGEKYGVEVEHYIISSGLHEIIEGSSIYKNFKEVYACEFLYDENDVACWPKNAVNYTTKTQFLFRINKGVLDISESEALNKYTPLDERRVPFRNMIYIGDGLTDVPCMRLVKSNGGASIAVYTEGNKSKVVDLIRDGRVNFIEPADYSEGSSIEKTIDAVICKMAMENVLVEKTASQLKDL